MNDNKFDELAKGLAESVTRRCALKRFGLGLAGLVLTALGVADQAQASHCKSLGQRCHDASECCLGLYCNAGFLIGRNGVCVPG
jgi:hypothetical protein